MSRFVAVYTMKPVRDADRTHGRRLRPGDAHATGRAWEQSRCRVAKSRDDAEEVARA